MLANPADWDNSREECSSDLSLEPGVEGCVWGLGGR